MEPFAEHFYAAAYKDFRLMAPANVAFLPEMPMVHTSNRAIIDPVARAFVEPTLSNVVGWTLGIEVSDGNPSMVTAKALATRALKRVPVYAYMGGFMPTDRVEGVDYPILQAYRVPSEPTPSSVFERLYSAVERCRAAYPRVAVAVDLTARTLDRYPAWTEAERLETLGRLVAFVRKERPVAVFAWAWDRRVPQAGISSSSVVADEWARFVAAIPNEVPVQKPEVNIKDYGPDRITVDDPANHTRVVVELLPTANAHERQLYVSILNDKGDDRSAKQRLIQF